MRLSALFSYFCLLIPGRICFFWFSSFLVLVCLSSTTAAVVTIFFFGWLHVCLWCYHYYYHFFCPPTMQRRCLSDTNRISFHKAAVAPNMKSNGRTIMQWYLPPTICPFPFPTSSPFIYYFLSLYIPGMLFVLCYSYPVR